MRGLLVAIASALVALAPPAGRAGEPTVILISLDGTRPADVETLPTFRRIAAAGAWAEDGLLPAFPSNTFPNHATFATGVSPERHGIVDNAFVDRDRGRFHYDGDPTWLEVEPIWSLAARGGLVSASYHWVGSEGPWRSGLGPRHWKRFDGAVQEAAKVEQVLAWLALPEPSERPRLVTAWFHGADAAAHRDGPDSQTADAALAPQDAALGALLDGLAARGLAASTTLVVVSDHGMTAARRAVDLADALEEAGVDAEVLGGGGFVQLVCRQAGCADAAVGVARAAGLEAFPRGACPGTLSCTNPRFGDVLVIAPLGTRIASQPTWLRVLASLGVETRGVHGHRPELPEMRGLFAAIGRGVAPGARPERVRAVDVAPTVLALLDLPVPDWMEGRPVALSSLPSTGASR